jgi:arrestin-related trafficking adapter 3/6
VHRPGAFTSKLTAVHDVILVATPGEEDTEESDNIIVERLWDDQLQYIITISGKSFPIGGHIPVSFILMPLEKVNVYRISILLEGVLLILFSAGFHRTESGGANRTHRLL